MKILKHISSLWLTIVIVTFCISGCKTTTILEDTKNKGNLSIQVILNTDGTFTYLGDVYERDEIPKVLKKTGASMGRSVTIKANNNVKRKALVEARQFLVYKGFPNVTIVTQKLAFAYEEPIDEESTSKESDSAK